MHNMHIIVRLHIHMNLSRIMTAHDRWSIIFVIAGNTPLHILQKNLLSSHLSAIITYLCTVCAKSCYYACGHVCMCACVCLSLYVYVMCMVKKKHSVTHLLYRSSIWVHTAHSSTLYFTRDVCYAWLLIITRVPQNTYPCALNTVSTDCTCSDIVGLHCSCGSIAS